MASSVFYKFKSQRSDSKVNFDGTGISVFDLKKEIILANNLGKANDFDLAVYDASSNEEYKDDSYIIPRSSSVVVKRIFARPGKGKAALYLAGSTPSTGSADSSSKPSTTAPGSHSWHKGNISKRFDNKEEAKPTSKSTPVTIKGNVQEDEAAAMAAMFQAQSANWEETQEKMSHAVRVYTNPRGGGSSGRGTQARSHHQSDRPLPPSYVCYRCGQKGHWIQDCPTNNDREFDNRPRIKRTTGIPRSFLKAVESPAASQLGHGVMVTAEGSYVVAQPDSASWQKQVSRHKKLTEADVRDRKPTDSSLVCPIDKKLFRDAVKTPCCGTLYCEECVQTHLLERDFNCPNCSGKIPSLDKLLVDRPMRAKVRDYIEKEIEKSKLEGDEGGRMIESAPQSASSEKGPTTEDVPGLEQEYYSDQQPGTEFDLPQMVADTIPQLQAQIAQISIMLNNPSLPLPVRQQTEMQYQQLQMQLQEAQIAATLMQASNAAVLNMQQQAQQQAQQQQQQQVVQQQQAQAQAAAAAAQQMQQMAAAAAAFGQQGPVGHMMGVPPHQQHMQHDPRSAGWTNPYSTQQPAGQDSAYQRLPVNNRRRNLKRDRPSDFLEVAGSDQDPKVPRYWE